MSGRFAVAPVREEELPELLELVRAYCAFYEAAPADADFDAVIRGRMVHDVAGHYNRSGVYQLLVNNEPSELITMSQPGAPVPEDADPSDENLRQTMAATVGQQGEGR